MARDSPMPFNPAPVTGPRCRMALGGQRRRNVGRGGAGFRVLRMAFPRRASEQRRLRPGRVHAREAHGSACPGHGPIRWLLDFQL